MPRGGARPGAGAKPRQISEKEKRRILRAVNALSKITGRSPHDIFAEILVTGKYNGHEVEIKEWLAAFKIHTDLFLVRSSHKVVEQHQFGGPAIFLPEIKRPENPDIVFLGKRGKTISEA